MPKSTALYINSNNEELAQVCQLARQQSAVALDTEFMRVSTYYPKLGLIQLYDGDRVSLIDPLSITDFSPFVELLRDQQVTKILHACNEDLLVFLQEFDALPQPMMDTQIMARFLGFANSAGLAKLVLHYLGIEMDKGATRYKLAKTSTFPRTATICRRGCMVSLAGLSKDANRISAITLASSGN